MTAKQAKKFFRGGGSSKSDVTLGGGGSSKSDLKWQGGGRGQKSQNGGDVIYEHPLAITVGNSFLRILNLEIVSWSRDLPSTYILREYYVLRPLSIPKEAKVC